MRLNILAMIVIALWNSYFLPTQLLNPWCHSHRLFRWLTSTGNVLMLSEGRPGVDNVFSLRDGRANLSVSQWLGHKESLPQVY